MTKGPKQKKGVVWFPELVDVKTKFMNCNCSCCYDDRLFCCYKGRNIKMHLYWCMKNCHCLPQVLLEMVLNKPHHHLYV